MRNRLMVLVFCMAAVAGLFAISARGDKSDKRTIFTFSAPVEIPGGRVLPAGTYTFKLLDTSADRNIVQIFNKDQTTLYATVLAIPDYRRNPTDKVLVTFEETKQGGPPAIKEWFYPGESYGQEFVYPKPRAVEIAKNSNQPVPSMSSESASNISQSATSSNDASVVAMKDTPLKAEEANGDEVEVAEVFIVHPVLVAENTAAELPKTASMLPLLWLLGIIFTALGAAFWLIAKHRIA
ncbi:MAG: hypothetical protein WCA91_24595 [Candidatus Acidiferrales bacterium]